MIQSSIQPHGLIRLLYLYGVAKSIDLAKLRGLLGARGGSAEQAFPRRTPGYVRFEQAPIVEPAVRELARRRLDLIRDAVNRPTGEWLQEYYLIVEIREMRDAEGKQPAASRARQMCENETSRPFHINQLKNCPP